MRRRLILLAFVLATVALPLQFSFAYEAFATAKFGTYMQDGQRADFGLLTGSQSVLVTQKENNVRAMVFNGVFHVQESDEVQGLATFFVLEKRVPLKNLEFYGQFGTGSLWQIKEGADALTADLLLESGIRIKNWVNIGVGLNYLPQKGSDATFLYVSLNLVPSM